MQCYVQSMLKISTDDDSRLTYDFDELEDHLRVVEVMKVTTERLVVSCPAAVRHVEAQLGVKGHPSAVEREPRLFPISLMGLINKITIF